MSDDHAIIVALRELADVVHRQQKQLIALMDMVATLSDAILTTHEPDAPSPARTMPFGRGWIVRQPMGEQGHLVSYVTDDGQTRDQAFQFMEGDWHSVRINDEGKLVVQDKRDALHTG